MKFFQRCTHTNPSREKDENEQPIMREQPRLSPDTLRTSIFMWVIAMSSLSLPYFLHIRITEEQLAAVQLEHALSLAKAGDQFAIPCASDDDDDDEAPLDLSDHNSGPIGMPNPQVLSATQNPTPTSTPKPTKPPASKPTKLPTTATSSDIPDTPVKGAHCIRDNQGTILIASLDVKMPLLPKKKKLLTNPFYFNLIYLFIYFVVTSQATQCVGMIMEHAQMDMTWLLCNPTHTSTRKVARMGWNTCQRKCGGQLTTLLDTITRVCMRADQSVSPPNVIMFVVFQ
jgi:hypothetical protein